MGNMVSEKLSYYHNQREVRLQMDDGGCAGKFNYSLWACEKWRRKKGTANDVRECREATAALRKCMERNEPHFRTCIAAMDRGLQEDEYRKWYQSLPDHQRWRWRWWTGMLRP